MIFVLYNLNRIPTGVPAYTVGQGMYAFIDYIANRIIVFLQAVPVVPNASGLFDANGNWLTPTVSFFDVMLASFIFVTVFSIFRTITVSSPGLASVFRSGGKS